MTDIHLIVDKHEVVVPEGSTLLDATRSIQKDVPVICYHELTTPEGICRQCVVEVKGWRLLAPACVTEVQDGMVVETNSERVRKARKTI